MLRHRAKPTPRPHRLTEAEETLRAIRHGEVDAVVVQTPQGEQVFTLRGADHPYRVMVEEMAEGAVTFSREGTILFCNQRFAGLLRAPLQEVIGSTVFVHVAPADRATLRTLLQAFHGLAGRGEINFLSQDADAFPASIAVAPLLLDGNVPAFCMVVNDLSERRRLERQVLEVAEHEQQRLGQELHDGLGQVLVGIKLLLEGVAGDSPKSQARLKKIRELLGTTVEQTRELAKGFYPVELERHGLPSALEELAGQACQTFGVHCRAESRGSLRPIEPEAQIHLFRIAQEAVRNAASHGRAKTIRVGMWQVGPAVVLKISSDGAPFPPERLQHSLAHGRGMGLRIMHYRARMIGARLTIEPLAAGGCVVKCAMPRAAFRR